MQNLDTILSEAYSKLEDAHSIESIEAARIHLLGKSGVISEQMKKIGQLPPEERKAFGAQVNNIKAQITEKIENKKSEFENRRLEEKLKSEMVDITMPARPVQTGSIHPISQVIGEITAIFTSMGFAVAEGPDLENDFNNFTALNIPEEHPARQMHDTFYLNKKDKDGNPYVLRTHTSPVQIRTMLNGKPPLKVIAPGRTYRSDSDITHSPMFHQMEALYVDKDVNMGHLKWCIAKFLREFFELDDVPLRFRPSFFPFTEPSAEVDIGCKKSRDQIIIGKGNDWLEIMGCGIVHPNVLKNCNIDTEKYTGFAFGVGIERLAMLKYGIPDLRTFFDSDIRWLEHFGF